MSPQSLSLTAACGTHLCPNTTTSRRASLKPFTKYFRRDLKNCSSVWREIAERKLLLNLSSALCLIHLCIMEQSKLIISLLLILYLFSADRNLFREWFGLEGISKGHPALDLPRSSCCTIQAQTLCYCGAVDFLQGCGRSHGAGMLLEHCGFTIPCPLVLLDSVSLAYLHQIRCSVLALSELQHNRETRMSKARNWQQRFDFCSHFISPSPGWW